MDVYAEVGAFYENYRGEKRIIGRSAEGRFLYTMKVGRGESVGISQYAIHAREWITSLLALEHIRRGGITGSVWILPLMNPDGALLATKGIESVSKGRREALLQINRPHPCPAPSGIRGQARNRDFSLWKANAEGVDLNVNFDARWGTGAKNRRTPGPENYIGKTPCSAPETAALCMFTREIKPRYTVSWHTKGEEIYWRFHQPLWRLMRDFRLARVLSKATGYPLREAKSSAGGYKDWCVEKLKIPAFTVEVGRDDLPHPLGMESLDDILRKNLDALVRLSARVK